MKTIVLGKTGLAVNKNGFGALPIQRVSKKEAVYLLQKAFYHGINYFDTARAYSDSEEKLGAAFSYVRERIIISTKTGAQTGEELQKDLEQSLKMLNTDYIDLYQFHNPAFCPKPGDGSGLYEAALKAREQGKIRHIGITNHRLSVAKEAIASGLYETLQFPFSYLASQAELELVKSCQEHKMGFIAMKALAGGLITDAACAYAYLDQFDCVEPIWGIQRERELDEFLPVRRRRRFSPKRDRRRSRRTAGSWPETSAGLRLLHALSGRHRDQQLCPHEPDAAPRSPGGLAVRRVAGEDEKNRKLPPTLQRLQQEVPLWA